MNESLKTSFIKDNIVSLSGTFIVYLKAIILMPLIINTMGVTAYGGYVLFISLISIVSGLSSFGVGVSSKRFLPSCQTNDEKLKLFYPPFLFGFASVSVSALLLFIFNDQITDILFDNELNYSPYLFPAYLLAYLIYGQGADYFRYTSRVKITTLATTIFPYLSIAIVMTLFFSLGMVNINTLVASEALSAILIGTSCFIFIFKEIGYRISFYKIKDLIKEIKLGAPLAFNILVDFILAASDRYVLSYFISITAVGYYNPAYLLGSLMMIVPKALGLVIPQLLSKSIDKGAQKSAETMVNYSIKIFLLVAIPFVFGTLLLSRDILILLANEDVAEQAHLIVSVVAIGIIFYGLTYLLTSVLFVQLKTKVMLMVNIIAAGLNLLLNLILLSIFKDIMTAALTTVLSYLVSFVYLNHKISINWKVNYDLKSIIKIILAASTMTLLTSALIPYLTDINQLLRIMVILIIALVSYISMLFLFKTFSQKEIEFLRINVLKQRP